MTQEEGSLPSPRSDVVVTDPDALAVSCLTCPFASVTLVVVDPSEFT